MSGGSMNYLYSKLEYDANFDMDTPERRAFAKHLKLVAKALHDIEWVDSGDYGPGGDTEAIRACLSSGATLNETVQAADRGSELSEGLGISVSSDQLTDVLALNDQAGEIARINADGTTFYDWSKISALAAQWRPYCSDFGINLARLLAPLQPRDF